MTVGEIPRYKPPEIVTPFRPQRLRATRRTPALSRVHRIAATHVRTGVAGGDGHRAREELRVGGRRNATSRRGWGTAMVWSHRAHPGSPPGGDGDRSHHRGVGHGSRGTQ